MKPEKRAKPPADMREPWHFAMVFICRNAAPEWFLDGERIDRIVPWYRRAWRWLKRRFARTDYVMQTFVKFNAPEKRPIYQNQLFDMLERKQIDPRTLRG